MDCLGGVRDACHQSGCWASEVLPSQPHYHVRDLESQWASIDWIRAVLTAEPAWQLELPLTAA